MRMRGPLGPMCPTRCCTPTITFSISPGTRRRGRLKAADLHDVLKRAKRLTRSSSRSWSTACSAWESGPNAPPDNRSFEITAVKGKEIFSKRRNEILKEEFGNRDRIETLARHRVRAAARLGKTLDYDKVKTEIKNEIGKATAKRKVVLTFEEKLAGLRAQMTPEIRTSLQEEAVKAGRAVQLANARRS